MLESIESRLYSSLIDLKVKVGFHEILGKDPDIYKKELFQKVIESNISTLSPGLLLSVVETRIPLVQQAALMGIDIDPAIFYTVKQDLDQLPYALWLKLATYSNGLLQYSRNMGETIAKLPTEIKHASLLEAINCDINRVLEESFILADGNKYEPSYATAYADALGKRSRVMCLDRYLGKVRITQISRSDYTDTMIGVLQKHQ